MTSFRDEMDDAQKGWRSLHAALAKEEVSLNVVRLLNHLNRRLHVIEGMIADEIEPLPPPKVTVRRADLKVVE